MPDKDPATILSLVMAKALVVPEVPLSDSELSRRMAKYFSTRSGLLATMLLCWHLPVLDAGELFGETEGARAVEVCCTARRVTPGQRRIQPSENTHRHHLRGDRHLPPPIITAYESTHQSRDLRNGFGAPLLT